MITITNYRLVKYYERFYQYSEFRYEHIIVTHPGCYKLVWKQSFATERHLIEYLRQCVKTKTYTFSSNLEGTSADMVTLINTEKKLYRLVPKKKYNPFKEYRGKRYNKRRRDPNDKKTYLEKVRKSELYT